MSRVGNTPVPLPDGVEVAKQGETLTVTGPQGSLSQHVPAEIGLEVSDGQVSVTRPDDSHERRARHGLVRSLAANMITGVSTGYRSELELVGVGYRVTARGEGVSLQVGYSHRVDFDPPEGVTFEVPSATRLAVLGADKRLVGQVAADIRGVRPPEPYKGKGIRYAGEEVRRKAGKAGAK
jgi:large subunit ribosomal protein L6